MESLYFLIPFALIFIVIAIKVLFWAINSGQYDNLDTEAHRILFDNDKTKSTTSSNPSNTTSENSLESSSSAQEKKNNE